MVHRILSILALLVAQSLPTTADFFFSIAQIDSRASIATVSRLSAPLQSHIRLGQATPVKRIEPLFPALDHSGITSHHKQLLHDVVTRTLPDHCRKQLKTIRVLYNNAAHRGLAGQTTMILDGSMPDDEFRAVAIHELGHIIDTGCNTGDPRSGISAFMDGSKNIWNDDQSVSFYKLSWLNETTKKADSAHEDFISGYSLQDPFEDFSEHFAAYALQRDIFEKRAQKSHTLQQKYDWMALHFASLSLVSAGATGVGKHPWDVTKLEYKWKKEVNEVISMNAK